MKLFVVKNVKQRPCKHCRQVHQYMTRKDVLIGSTDKARLANYMVPFISSIVEIEHEGPYCDYPTEIEAEAQAAKDKSNKAFKEKLESMEVR